MLRHKKPDKGGFSAENRAKTGQKNYSNKKTGLPERKKHICFFRLKG
jgi:hypothetical protein